MSGYECVCNQFEGWDKVLCLAPPPGEYEVHIKISNTTTLVINENGFFARMLSIEETLPFMVTHDRVVDSKYVEKYLSVEEALCLVSRALLEAAKHGSYRAKKKLLACKDFINNVKSACK